MKPLSQCRLYTFVDTAYLRGRSPEEVARALCDGGSDVIQLRAKTSSPEEVHRMAEAIAPITEAAGVWLVINDFPQVALAVRAPLYHLGQEDLENLKAQISNLKLGLQLGVSTHAPEQAERAMAAGAAYLGVGPVYATGTKPTAKPVTLEYVRWAAGHVRIPWFAIGGINLRNLEDVLEAGARRICVVSAILDAPDIAEACQQFKQRLLSVTR